MDGNAFAMFVAGSRWQFAKTMASIPHAYTRRVWCDDKAFEDAVIFIRANGYQGEFYSRAYLYYDLGSYQYWTMGDPVGETILINRALKPGEEECGPLASPGTSLQLKAALEAEGVKFNEDGSAATSSHFSPPAGL